MTNQIRKLYIDSRIGCRGSPDNFTFIVPSAVSTTVDEGIVISQLNMPNLFQTIMQDFSDKLYFSLNLQDQLGLVTGTNNRIYVRTRIFTPGAGIVFTGYILTIATGVLRDDRCLHRSSPDSVSGGLAELDDRCERRQVQDHDRREHHATHPELQRLDKP